MASERRDGEDGECAPGRRGWRVRAGTTRATPEARRGPLVTPTPSSPSSPSRTSSTETHTCDTRIPRTRRAPLPRNTPWKPIQPSEDESRERRRQTQLLSQGATRVKERSLVSVKKKKKKKIAPTPRASRSIDRNVVRRGDGSLLPLSFRSRRRLRVSVPRRRRLRLGARRLLRLRLRLRSVAVPRMRRARRVSRRVPPRQSLSQSSPRLLHLRLLLQFRLYGFVVWKHRRVAPRRRKRLTRGRAFRVRVQFKRKPGARETRLELFLHTNREVRGVIGHRARVVRVRQTFQTLVGRRRRVGRCASPGTGERLGVGDVRPSRVRRRGRFRAAAEGSSETSF